MGNSNKISLLGHIDICMANRKRTESVANLTEDLIPQFVKEYVSNGWCSGHGNKRDNERYVRKVILANGFKHLFKDDPGYNNIVGSIMYNGLLVIFSKDPANNTVDNQENKNEECIK